MEEKKQMKLLVVEDEPFLRDLLLMKFKIEEVLVTYTENGEQAVEIAKKEKPDAVLLDLILPGMSGFEVLEKLKEEDDTRNIPVIILSNLGQKADIQRCKKLGAVDFLIKAHTSPSSITHKVQEILKNTTK